VVGSLRRRALNRRWFSCLGQAENHKRSSCCGAARSFFVDSPSSSFMRAYCRSVTLSARTLPRAASSW